MFNNENTDASYNQDGSLNLNAFVREVRNMIDDCDNLINQKANIRQKALDYYEGNMSDLPNDQGRSSVVSRDVRSEVKKILPAIMRTLFANDKIVTYTPVDQNSEQQAEQATDYINLKIIPEAKVEDAICDAIFDALLLKTGILKTAAYMEKISQQYRYTGQPADAVVLLSQDPQNEIFDLEEIPEEDPEILFLEPDAVRYNFTLKRTEEYVKPCIEAVQRDRFLIYPSAQSIEESPIVGEKEYVTRSDLVERGYDRDMIYDVTDNLEEDISGDKISREGEDYVSNLQGNRNTSQQLVLIYTVYVKYDLNDDGISELYKVVLLDSGISRGADFGLLYYEEVDEVPYFAVKIEREAFEFEGRSLAEDINEIQKINTAFLRGVVDNTYWQNNQQIAVQYEALTEDGRDAISNPEFGRPIAIKQNYSVAEAIQPIVVPFIADKIFPIMNYFNEQKRDRTGLTDQSALLDPNKVSNIAVGTANIVNEASQAQSEMMIRTLAKGGIKDAFRSLLKLVIVHSNKPQTLKIKGEWQEYDPRVWNTEMNCTVNVGLGGSSKQYAMAMMNNILALQEKLFAAFGSDNPFVKPDQVYNVLEKITEAAGLPSATPYFTRPDPQEIAAKLEAQRNQPTAEDKKLQNQMAIEKYKADRRTDVETAQLIADKEVEDAQMIADIAVEEARAENRTELENQKIAADLAMHQDKMDLEYTKLGQAKH